MATREASIRRYLVVQPHVELNNAPRAKAQPASPFLWPACHPSFRASPSKTTPLCPAHAVMLIRDTIIRHGVRQGLQASKQAIPPAQTHTPSPVKYYVGATAGLGSSRQPASPASLVVALLDPACLPACHHPVHVVRVDGKTHLHCSPDSLSFSRVASACLVFFFFPHNNATQTRRDCDWRYAFAVVRCM